MSKTANERRKKWLEQVRLVDEERKKKAAKARPIVKPKRKAATPRIRVADSRCCMEKHEGNLPSIFVPCRDCPNKDTN